MTVPLYADIECKHEVHLEASRHVYGHENTARRIETRLKRRHCVIPSFVHIELCRSPSFCMLHCQRKLKYSHQVDRPLCCKCQRTVRAETGRVANMSISWLMVRDEARWFCMIDPTMWLFSRALVMEGRKDPACRSIWPSATHWFHIHMTLDGCRPVWRTISWNDNPHYW